MAPPTPQNIVVATRVSDALAKMETAIVELGNSYNIRQGELEKKVENLTKTVKGFPSEKEISGLRLNMDSLTQSFTDSVKKIDESCQSVSSLSVKLSEDEICQLSDQVVTRVVPAVSSKVNDNLVSLSDKMDNLSIVTGQVHQGFVKSESEQLELRNSLAGLPKLVTTLQGILDNPKTSINMGNKTPSTQPSDSRNQASDKPKLRKCLVFTSSLAVKSEVARLQAELNADVKIISTYFIENNSQLTEKDAYLALKINQEMNTDLDFVIIQVGSNEMSQLDLKEEKRALFDKMQHDCNTLVNLSKHLVEEYSVDVFISEKPPRYDQEGGLEGLNNTSNSILHMLTHLLDRVWVVKQSMLESKSDRIRSERFQADGLHLTEKGLALLNTNWIDCIRRVYSDLSQTLPRTGGPGVGSGGGGSGSGGNYNPQQHQQNYRGGGERYHSDGNGYNTGYHDRDQQQFSDNRRDQYDDNRGGGYRGRGRGRGGGNRDRRNVREREWGYENRNRGGRGGY